MIITKESFPLSALLSRPNGYIVLNTSLTQYTVFWKSGQIGTHTHTFLHLFFYILVMLEKVGFQMVFEDGQGLCCPSFRGKLVPTLGCYDREDLGLG